MTSTIASTQQLSSPDSTTKSDVIKTRLFIISDTHGINFEEEERCAHYADVAIHCGDLTEESKLEDFRNTLQLLKKTNAPLKLVIAGNHDFTMDIPIFKENIAEAYPPLDPDLVKKIYGDYGEARQLFDDAKSDNIISLDEGTHQFHLNNGATLTIYASPYTPSLGNMGFQYPPKKGHTFSIPAGVDLAITHGPPQGILDYTHDKKRAGCPYLFGAIASARPRLHCFGHIHEGWGARMVSWREQLTENPSYFTDIDNANSTVIAKLPGITKESKDEWSLKEAPHRQERCYITSHCKGDALPLEYGKQTLFINAAIQGTVEKSLQLPWLVELELPKTGSH